MAAPDEEICERTRSAPGRREVGNCVVEFSRSEQAVPCGDSVNFSEFDSTEKDVTSKECTIVAIVIYYVGERSDSGLRAVINTGFIFRTKDCAGNSSEHIPRRFTSIARRLQCPAQRKHCRAERYFVVTVHQASSVQSQQPRLDRELALTGTVQIVRVLRHVGFPTPLHAELMRPERSTSKSRTTSTMVPSCAAGDARQSGHDTDIWVRKSTAAHAS